MTYNASSELVSEIIKLSAEIVVGLGTTITCDRSSELFSKLETALEQLDIAEVQPSGRYERSLVKAADRAVQRYSFAVLSGSVQLDENVADIRDELNFDALSKALMAFDNGEAKSEINHLLPTVYIWQERLPVGTRIEGMPVMPGDSDQLYWRVQPFADGRPMESLDSNMCRQHYKTREYALECVQRSEFAVTVNQMAGISPEAPGPNAYQIVEQEAPKPYLYILMRNDLASLNAGKAVAQGTHAANQMVGELRARELHPIMDPSPYSIHAALKVWEKEAHHFGTCIVLAVNEKQMRSSVELARTAALPSHAGICHDPTYPLMDGKTFHFIPVDTCAYVFDYPARAKRHLVGYPLMP